MARYQRDPEEARKKFETPFLNQQSKHLSALDKKNNQAPLGFQPKKPLDTRSDKSKAFQKRWLGA